MKRKGVGFSLPVTVVMLVIGFIYFSTVFTFIDRWFSLTSSPGIANAAAFTALALMCLYNYSIAIFRDPGRVPLNYMPDVEDPESPVHEIKRKVTSLCLLLSVNCFWDLHFSVLLMSQFRDFSALFVFPLPFWSNCFPIMENKNSKFKFSV